jgi:hypothetical protein
VVVNLDLKKIIKQLEIAQGGSKKHANSVEAHRGLNNKAMSLLHKVLCIEGHLWAYTI